ncbi:hypothetical protein [Pontibacter sp. HSC-36F09]|uniref:hypothetical protein n=1 Tax=Pontibacter sp. HSC-36F09 TaxID=2910966 RepID=UPI0020A03E8A|nr:hypothetical protein [Pontibacter sp. HSC-36F09]MCP2043498.1 hypothetical protein [Pontibacter sp. HSC-36F09]
MTEPDKNLNEALFRSHQATEKDNQAQSELHSMSTGQQKGEQPDALQPKLHETPRNLLQSWDTLRQMDMDLADKKPDHDRKS